MPASAAGLGPLPVLRYARATSAKVIGGYARPYGGPNLWSSQALAWDANPWLQLTWPEPVTLSEVVVILDADVQEDLINLHHHLPIPTTHLCLTPHQTNGTPRAHVVSIRVY